MTKASCQNKPFLPLVFSAPGHTSVLQHAPEEEAGQFGRRVWHMSSKPRPQANLYHAVPNPLINLCVSGKNVHLHTAKVPVISQSQALFPFMWFGMQFCFAGLCPRKNHNSKPAQKWMFSKNFLHSRSVWAHPHHYVLSSVLLTQ